MFCHTTLVLQSALRPLTGDDVGALHRLCEVNIFDYPYSVDLQRKNSTLNPKFQGLWQIYSMDCWIFIPWIVEN
jgi:hypothetical protein